MKRRRKDVEKKKSIVDIRIHVANGYRVPNQDPRDRVIRIEMNVNPLNTIPGQNTATRGSESGQIRYRVACERMPCHDPVGCSCLILSHPPSRHSYRSSVLGIYYVDRTLNLVRASAHDARNARCAVGLTSF